MFMFMDEVRRAKRPVMSLSESLPQQGWVSFSLPYPIPHPQEMMDFFFFFGLFSEVT